MIFCEMEECVHNTFNFHNINRFLTEKTKKLFIVILFK